MTAVLRRGTFGSFLAQVRHPESFIFSATRSSILMGSIVVCSPDAPSHSPRLRPPRQGADHQRGRSRALPAIGHPALDSGELDPPRPRGGRVARLRWRASRPAGPRRQAGAARGDVDRGRAARPRSAPRLRVHARARAGSGCRGQAASARRDRASPAGDAAVGGSPGSPALVGPVPRMGSRRRGLRPR